MTDEYIKREDAIKAASDGADEWDGGWSIERDKRIAKYINAVPTADVRPVVRGRWVDSKLDGVPSHCSECNYPIDRFYKTRFCPNCGADMGEAKT